MTLEPHPRSRVIAELHRVACDQVLIFGTDFGRVELEVNDHPELPGCRILAESLPAVRIRAVHAARRCAHVLVGAVGRVRGVWVRNRFLGTPRQHDGDCDQ